MEDIAPALYEALAEEFESNLSQNKKAATLLKKIASGKARYSDAGDYADEIGDALARAFKSCISDDALPDGKMYWNIAQRTVWPLYEREYKLASSAAASVQQTLNASAEIGLMAQVAKMDTENLKNIMDMLCAADQYSQVETEFLESTTAFAREAVDQTLEENIDFQSQSGLQPKVVRTALAQCCPWCADLEGTYYYPNIPADVYKRHDNCKCSIEYEAGSKPQTTARARIAQKAPSETAKIEERKNFDGISARPSEEKLAELRTYGL